jgi:hypothetical protein
MTTGSAARRLACGAAILVTLFVAGCGGSSSSNSSPSAPAATQTTHESQAGGIPQNNGGDHDSDNNGGPSDGDGNV